MMWLAKRLLLPGFLILFGCLGGQPGQTPPCAAGEPEDFARLLRTYEGERGERYRYCGGTWTQEEEKADRILTSLREEYLRHFGPFYGKDDAITGEMFRRKRASPLGRWMKRMPKGAHLHTHLAGMVPVDWVFQFLGSKEDAWDLDLRVLKQICINGVGGCFLSAGERGWLRKRWEGAWKRFIHERIAEEESGIELISFGGLP